MNTFRKIAALAVTFSGLLLAQTPAIKVYVFSSGDSTTDGAVTQALKDRGYQVTLGVRTGDFDGTTVQLTGYDTVVALGSGGNVPAGGITALQRFLQGSGGLILDAPMLDGNLSNDRSGVLIPHPSSHTLYLSTPTSRPASCVSIPPSRCSTTASLPRLMFRCLGTSLEIPTVRCASLRPPVQEFCSILRARMRPAPVRPS